MNHWSKISVWPPLDTRCCTAGSDHRRMQNQWDDCQQPRSPSKQKIETSRDYSSVLLIQLGKIVIRSAGPSHNRWCPSHPWRQSHCPSSTGTAWTRRAESRASSPAQTPGGTPGTSGRRGRGFQFFKWGCPGFLVFRSFWEEASAINSMLHSFPCTLAILIFSFCPLWDFGFLNCSWRKLTLSAQSVLFKVLFITDR